MHLARNHDCEEGNATPRFAVAMTYCFSSRHSHCKIYGSEKDRQATTFACFSRVTVSLAGPPMYVRSHFLKWLPPTYRSEVHLYARCPLPQIRFSLPFILSPLKCPLKEVAKETTIYLQTALEMYSEHSALDAPRICRYVGTCEIVSYRLRWLIFSIGVRTESLGVGRREWLSPTSIEPPSVQ